MIIGTVNVIIMAKYTNTSSFFKMRNVSCLGFRDMNLKRSSYYLSVLHWFVHLLLRQTLFSPLWQGQVEMEGRKFWVFASHSGASPLTGNTMPPFSVLQIESRPLEIAERADVSAASRESPKMPLQLSAVCLIKYSTKHNCGNQKALVMTFGRRS